jgi:hypothetical protein
MPHTVHHLPPNPYENLNRDFDLSRLSADISYEDKKFLHQVFPAKGLFNRMTQLFFHSITEECKQNGITTYTPENADAFVRLVTRRCATPEPAREVVQPDVTRRAKSPRDYAPGGLKQSDDAEEESECRKSGSQDEQSDRA